MKPLIHSNSHNNRNRRSGRSSKYSERVLRWSLLITGIALIAYFSILSVAHFISPYLQAHNQQLTARINEISPYPFNIKSFSLNKRNLRPVLQFHDVTIFSDAEKTQELLHIDELSVGINVWRSLLHRRFEIGTVKIVGITLDIETDKNGVTRCGALVFPSLTKDIATTKTSDTSALLQKILSLQRLVLDKVTVTWRRPNQPVLKISRLRCKLANRVLRRQLLISGYVMPYTQPATAVPASFTFDVNFSRPWWHFAGFISSNTANISGASDILSIKGATRVTLDIKMENLNLFLPKELFKEGSSALAVWSKFLPRFGEIVIRMYNTNFTADKWFIAPLTVPYFGAHVGWQNLAPGLQVRLEDVQLDLSTVDIQGGGFFYWRKLLPSDEQRKQVTAPSISSSSPTLFASPSSSTTTSTSPATSSFDATAAATSTATMVSAVTHGEFIGAPDVDLQFVFSAVQLEKIINYFPVKIMHPGLVDWLSHAFTSRGSLDGVCTLQGNLERFPFAHNEGIFKVNIDLNNIDLRYNQAWPLFHAMNGKLAFFGKKMDINIASAAIEAIPVRMIKAAIADLTAPTLIVAGQVRAATNLMQQFVNVSPLRDSVGKDLAYIALEGLADLSLKIVIPLHIPHAEVSVAGEIDLPNNTLFVPLWDLRLRNLKGAVKFTDNLINAPSISATLLEQPIILRIATVDEQHKNEAIKARVFDSVGATKEAANDSAAKVTQVIFTSMLPLVQLQKKFHLPLITNYAQGNFAYRGALTLPRNTSKTHDVTLDITSNLSGIKVNVPPFITKAANTLVDFKFHSVFRDAFTRANVLLQYGNKVSAALVFANKNNKDEAIKGKDKSERQDKGRESMEFVSGVLRFGNGAIASSEGKTTQQQWEAKTKGLAVEGRLEKVNWSEWQQYLFGSQSDKKNPQIVAKSGAATAAISTTTTSTPAASLSLISKIDLDIDKFYGLGQELSGLHVSVIPYDGAALDGGGSTNGGAERPRSAAQQGANAVALQINSRLPSATQQTQSWQTTQPTPPIKSTQPTRQTWQAQQLSTSTLAGKAWLVTLHNAVLNGKLVIPHDMKHEVFKAYFYQLHFPTSIVTEAESKEKKKSTTISINPRELPPLNVVVRDLRYGNKDLGRVEFQTTPLVDGLQIEWLLMNAAAFRIEATGKWQQINNTVQSVVRGKFTSSNVGAALKQLNFTKNVDRGVGAANFTLRWADAFFVPSPESMSGNVSVDVRRGRIINFEAKTEAELGIGRLLSIVSLQTLPRRLTLDFSDLLKDGFSFDAFTGSLQLNNGDAFTKNAELVGPVAQVKIRGRIGFGKKDYDMNLTVIPHLTSSLPVLAAAVAGGPVVGAATWLADKIVGNQVNSVMSHVYKVTGSWAKPDIREA